MFPGREPGFASTELVDDEDRGPGELEDGGPGLRLGPFPKLAVQK
jgi:hypothetical protein